MKHLLALMALCVAFAAGAQGTSIHEYPWNPDWDNDNFVGSSDLTGFLSAFGSEFGNPPEPCDYDGTPLEDLAIGIADGSIILDSLFIEYELEDVSTFFVLGCPEPVTDTLVFSNSMMLDNFYAGSIYWGIDGYDSYGFYSSLMFYYTLVDGLYFWVSFQVAISELGFADDGFFGGDYAASSQYAIPFPETWFLDEEGIHIESGWNGDDWPYYANYLHILPYWHYAE